MSFTVEDLIKLRRLNAIAVSQDASFAIAELSELSPDESKYISQLWRVDLRSGEKIQITFGEWSSRAPKFDFKDTLYFLSNRPPQIEDKKHAGRFQVYKIGAGDPVQVTEEPLGVIAFELDEAEGFVVKTKRFPKIDRDKQREHADTISEKGPSALSYKSTPVRYWDHWIGSAKENYVAYRKRKLGYEICPIAPVEDDVYKNSMWKLSHDGRFIITTYTHRPERREDTDRLKDSGLRKINIARGVEDLFTTCGHWISGFSISADDTTLCYVDFERLPDRFGRYNLVSMNLDSKEKETLKFIFDGTVNLGSFSQDSKHIYFTADFETTTSLFSYHFDTSKITRKTRRGSIHQYMERDATIIGIFSSIKSPPEIFVQSDEKFEVLSNLSDFSPPEGIDVTSLKTESTDGTDIQFFRVGNAKATRNMLAIHGGPIGQWGDVWHWRWNALVFAELGYEVFLPNPRGSTGFGQHFVDGIFGDTWGKQCYEDLMCVADEIERISDAPKTVAMGGSFGGYMTNWIGTQTDRFDALMTHAGLFDLHQFYGTTDNPAYWSRTFRQNVYEDRNAFDKYSPARFVSKWKTPTLVIHGEKDYRVPISEALYLFDALQYFEVESELLIFPDENHWILRPKNVVVWYRSIARFFDGILSAT